MNLAVLLATSGRVLRQLRHDPRTVALLLVVPVGLTGLLAWILSGNPGAFDRWGAVLVGIFPLMVMFLVTSVATLRERTGGTLERLMTMPLGKGDFLGGYALAFGAAATVQALVVSVFTFGLFGLDVAGARWAVLVVAVLDAVLGTALGLSLSAFARTEFQAVQFFPAVLLPQLLLCGLIAPRSTLPGPLEAVSAVLPLSYAVDAMQRLTVEPGVSAAVWRDLAVLVAFIVGLLAFGATTLRRRTP
ncbi:MAG: ABC transporter permease [Acidimicrobiales bacterium]|nr:ABC transporter permease [Acidimicrobiales bacterium]